MVCKRKEQVVLVHDLLDEKTINWKNIKECVTVIDWSQVAIGNAMKLILCVDGVYFNLFIKQ